MHDKINNVSSGAVKKATGKDWSGWIKFLDRVGAKDKSHKEIVSLVKEKGKVKSSWWQQMITVGYEFAKGKRVTGQTKGAGFQIGVQKKVPYPPKKVWVFLTSPKGLKIWFGKTDKFKVQKGFKYNVSSGIQGEIRSIKKGEKIRLTYNNSTLQVSLFCPINTKAKTNIRFHQENLKNPKERERARVHWQKTLQKISAAL